MSNVPLRDILITARQESHRMRHYYMGAEHLFIALLEIKSGLMSTILTEDGLSPDYVIDGIRRKIGKGGRQHLFTGTPNTPRTDVIMTIAQEIALENGRQNIYERDLLVAILDEGDNIPVRVLHALGLDLDDIRHKARTRSVKRSATQTFVQIDVGPGVGELSHDQLFILRRMFYGYDRLHIKTRLTGGYTTSDLFVVIPRHIDGRDDAAVVVKIGQSHVILDEAQRYERYVKNTLPPLTARLEDKPTAPETSNHAGLKYTLLTDGNGNAYDLRHAARDWTGERLGQWLRDKLYQNFAPNWWRQNRPYLFEIWREYDWVLPPMLTLELVDEQTDKTGATVLRAPIKNHNLSELDYGSIVVVQQFVVQKINRARKSIQLAVGQGGNFARAFQIEVRGIDFEEDTYYQGEVIEQLTGRVWRTRSEQLNISTRSLEPDFDINKRMIDVHHTSLPNPIMVINEYLDQRITGTMSTIHGDLHFGNILVGPGESALLIDFGHTREGHTLFDWATLEISILNDCIIPMIEHTWAGARLLLKHLITINQQQPATEPDVSANGTDTPSDLENALQAIHTLRDIVRENLARPNTWREYYIALAMVALRAVTWETLPVQSRRVMYLLAALCLYDFEHHDPTISGVNAPSSDDATTTMPDPDV